MSRLVLIIAVMSLFITSSIQVFGTEQDDVSGPLEFVATEDMDEGAVMARTTRGVIQAIDLENRTAEISGFIYDFGEPDDPLPVQVKMSGSEFGAFEMLRPNMKVEIVYGDTGEIRLAVRLQQLADDAELEVF